MLPYSSFLKIKEKLFSLEEITIYLDGKEIGKTHWPEAVQMVDSFPMTSTGKFQCYALRELWDREPVPLSLPFCPYGVNMKLKRIDGIRAKEQYGGYRVSIETLMGSARITIKVDITTGDEITPREVIYTFDLLLENRSIDILAYNIETVIAEKFETILTRGIANTRMRDFYDIYILLKLQGHQIENSLLGEAFRKTAEKRGSSTVLSNEQGVLDEILLDDILLGHWLRYQKKYTYADDITWQEIKNSIMKLWEIIVESI